MTNISTDLYQGLVEALDDVIICQDPDGRLTYVNGVFCDLFGGCPEAWLGQDFELDGRARSVMGPADLPDLDAFYESADGGRWISWQTRLYYDDKGLVTGSQSVGRDITHRKHHEETLEELRASAEEASRAKSLFLATMSHEIRTPMNGVLGMAALLKETGLTSEQEAYVRAIRESGEVLLSIINDVLDYSKIEAGKVKLDEDVFDLWQTAHSAVELLSLRAYEKGLDVGVFIDPACPPMLRGDEARLRQVILNLFNNGVKFTESGGVKLSIKHHGKRGEATSLLRFEIEDTGIGIPSDLQAVIFEEFAQADSSHARKYEGTGLGLAICKKLVEAMGGEIGLSSVHGEGSTFWFTLPFNAITSESSSEQSGLIGLKALVVSASDITRSSIAEQMGAGGADVVQACDEGEAVLALQNAHQAPFTTLIVDYALGEQVSMVLAKCLPKQEGVPVCRKIILLTPEDRGVLERLTEAGYDGYAIKPVRQHSLIERVECVHGLAATQEDFERDQARAARERQALSPDKDGPALRVLLAEDNEINAMLMQTLLQKAGHDVTWAHNGLEVLEFIDHGVFDVILMDMRMPELDGLEATRQIRERGDAASHLPIIALTANAMEEDRKRCLDMGMDDFLTKPVERGELERMLYRWTNPELPAKVS